MISGFLILNSGVRCVTRFYENINLGDLDLTTALLSAIVQFSKELKEGEVREVELGKRRFYITTENIIHFILIANLSSSMNTTSSEYYWKKLDKIKKIFFETFSLTEIHKKSGDLNYFSSFIPTLDEIFEEKRQKIQDTFFSVIKAELGKLTLLYNLKDQITSSNTNTLLNKFYEFVESDGIDLLYEAWSHPIIFGANKESSLLFVQNFYIGILNKNTDYTDPSIFLGFKFTVNQLRDIYYLAYYMQVLAESFLPKYRILYGAIFYNRPITGFFNDIFKPKSSDLSQLNDWFTYQNLVTESSLYISSQLEEFKHTFESEIIYAPLEINIDKILHNIRTILPQLIYAVLTQRRLVLLGEQIDVILTLRLIHYLFRIPVFNLWSNDPNPLSLVNGHPPTINTEIYPKENTTIIDLTTNDIKYGYFNMYCVQFSYGILEFSYYGLEKLRTYIDDKLNRLFNSISKIINSYHIDASRAEWKDILVQTFQAFLPEEQEMILRILEKMSPFLALTIIQLYYKKQANLKSYLLSLDKIYPQTLSELTLIQIRLLTYFSLLYRTQTGEKKVT